MEQLSNQTWREQLEALGQDKAFFAQLLACTGAEQISNMFAQKSWELAPEDAELLLVMIDRLRKGEDELSEAELEAVAGGAYVPPSQSTSVFWRPPRKGEPGYAEFILDMQETAKSFLQNTNRVSFI